MISAMKQEEISELARFVTIVCDAKGCLRRTRSFENLQMRKRRGGDHGG